ncbi:SDR family NAD(P)-dependent oxidoreductase [Solirubrobacter soli]|uniref:SDR family NAD(P)-dependent oxidoreductase n=1 Tax=Solirubrobacter soli TaxID=363832 RepID=UPI0003F6C754|nr:SDR family NAD(P)-dependent oxidoreductase [Solirubrobacter soli]
MGIDRPLAFVTGGSSGIGYELAKQLASHGHDVAVSGSSGRVHESAARLRELGGEAWSHQADASTYEGVESFWRFVEGLGRRVDVAVLNVGVAVGAAIADTPLDAHLRVLAINVVGTTHMAKRVVDHMVVNRTGRILIVSSISATTPTPYEGVYGATKAFGYNLAETLREEVRGHGVVVTALLPGATDSDFHSNGGMGADTPIGRMQKFPKEEVGRLGYEALMAGADMVVGGGPDARAAYERNLRTPEPEKAAAHAQLVRPDGRAALTPACGRG